MTILKGKLSLPTLLAKGHLHPKPCIAAKLLPLLESLGQGENADSFMAHAHLWAGWAPLLHFSPRHADMVKAKKALLAFAATEPASGSDIFALKTRAKKTKTGWVLNGEKTFITNGLRAGFILVLARPLGAAHPQDFACFLVPGNAKGLKRKKLKLMGLENADMATLQLKNVSVKDDALVGTLRQGAEVFRFAMSWERALILGSAPAALEKLAALLEKASRKKIRGGRALTENARFAGGLRSVRDQADEIRQKIKIAADSLDAGKNSFLLSASTKLEASILYEEASRTLLQLGGKDAFLAGSAIERNFRDSLASALYSGPNDLLGSLLEAAQ